MNPSDALDMVGLVGEIWPSWRGSDPEKADLTAREWATALSERDRIDVQEAIRLLGRLNRFPPSLAEILDGAMECRRDRAVQRGLPIATGLLRYACDDGLQCVKESPEWCDEPGHCCWHQPCGGPAIGLDDWYERLATPAERAILRRVGPSLRVLLAHAEEAKAETALAQTEGTA